MFWGFQSKGISYFFIYLIGYTIVYSDFKQDKKLWIIVINRIQSSRYQSVHLQISGTAADRNRGCCNSCCMSTLWCNCCSLGCFGCCWCCCWYCCGRSRTASGPASASRMGTSRPENTHLMYLYDTIIERKHTMPCYINVKETRKVDGDKMLHIAYMKIQVRFLKFSSFSQHLNS